LPELRPGASAYERASRDNLLRNGDLAARDAAIAEAALMTSNGLFDVWRILDGFYSLK
jgi:type IV secretion system protein VirB5